MDKNFLFLKGGIKIKILITGITGFIGSHTCVELLNSGYDIVGIDDFSNSKEGTLNQIRTITGKNVKFYRGNVLNEQLLRQIFLENKIDAVIHFAGFKAVGESVEKPIEYYHNNLCNTLVLCKVMRDFNCKKLIFSSSATVYGTPKSVPIREDFPIGKTINPYGTSKVMTEKILMDIAKADKDWSICLLRYFNPIGAHESGLIGEDPNGIPGNLMPYIIKVAAGILPEVKVFGNDYPTKDGTGVRDYIHVVDLARGHLMSLEKIFTERGVFIYNLGTGCGYSVMELINTFIRVNNVKVPYSITSRRAGDIAECYADPKKALKELKWQAQKDIEDMCRDGWHFWQISH